MNLVAKDVGQQVQEVTARSLFVQEKKLVQPPKMQSQKVILLAGPTACGKTTLSLMLAKALKGEIISADSMQVYRGMDIGTAKVSQEERQQIPHHLIDIRHVQESFNVVDFYYEAKKCCEAILARNHVPIVVGGTGFYFRSLLYGPPEGPPPLPHLRRALEENMEKEGGEALYAKLKSFDPAYASSITHGDRHKIIRALEIVTLTGQKVSAFGQSRKEVKANYKFCPWFLHRPREVLYKRIERRCEEMLEMGLLDEVQDLEKQGIKNNRSACNAIGYRQALDYLHSSRGEEDYEEMVREFKTASRHYAKRQFTWFRKEPLFRWLNVEVHDFEIAADMIIQDFLSTI